MKPPKEEVYPFHAYSAAGRIQLNEIKSLFPDHSVVRRDRAAIEVVLAEKQRIFIFEFSTVVFLNVDPDEHLDYLNVFAKEAGLRLLRGYDEDFAEDDYLLKITGEKLSSRFNAVELPVWDEQAIFMAAEVLAKSAALEVIETDVTDALQLTQETTNQIQSSRWRFTTRTKVIRFIAEGLETRHQLLNQLCLLQKPDLTWDHEKFHQFHGELIDNFELASRLREVEKVLELSQEVSTLQLEMLNTKRSELLEIIIILLIAFEIVQSLLPALFP